MRVSPVFGVKRFCACGHVDNASALPTCPQAHPWPARDDWFVSRWRGFGMGPGLSLAGDRVEHDEHLAHDGCEGDLAWTAIGLHQACVELAHDRIVADGTPRGVEQDLANPGAAVAGGGAGAALAAFSVARCEADKSGDFLAAELSQFGEFAEQGGSGDRADALEALKMTRRGRPGVRQVLF